MVQRLLTQIKTKRYYILSMIFKTSENMIALNRKTSSWASIEAEMLQGSILGINIIFNLITNGSLFADESSLFSVVHTMNTAINNLNNDLIKISD